jgi:hypothetical protein
METYNKRTWLNSEDSHYTGSVCCHDGVVSNRGKPAERYTFLEIASCHTKARIHTDDNLTLTDYIDKLKLLRSEIDAFITHLEHESN